MIEERQPRVAARLGGGFILGVPRQAPTDDTRATCSYGIKTAAVATGALG
jgi:hypothetical protein